MVLIFPIILALCLGLVLSFLLVNFFRKQDAPNLPPGHMGWPLLGETIGFLKPHKSNSIGSFLQQHCSRYGRIFKSHLFGSPTIVSCDHEFNLFILQNEEKLFQVSYPKSMQGILGKYSLIIATGEIHKKLRSFAVSFIGTSKSTPEFFHLAENMSISMMDSWKSCKPVSFYKEAKEARARLSSTVKQMIKEREQRNIVGLIERGDFLDVVLSKKSLTNDEIVSIVLDILLGGYETTATLMSLIVYFLGQAPNALENLKEEHQGIRKRKEDGEPLNWEDYKKMKFTRNVICEAMRCGNVVKFLHRKALQDVKYKDILIPSGWKVFPIFTAVNFDSALHRNPLEFNPWRWFDEETSKKVSPFGGGPRLCPGAELAKVEIACFLHHLVLNYRWKTKADDYPLAHPYVEFRRGLLLEIEPIGKIFGRES
ncbi:cytochrome p450 90a1 [Quercus suber]|uniref:Cytochrome p450 90a1 n=2 Tax=Quercus suber TaxID=58331 RepID=A0AAW0J8F9_QUESU